MDPLHDRFASLDRLPAPDVWADALRRAEVVPTPVTVEPTRSATIGRPRPTTSSRALLIAATIALLLTLVAGGLIVGSWSPKQESRVAPVTSLSPAPTTTDPAPQPTAPRAMTTAPEAPFIAFIRTSPGRRFDLWAIRADGSDAREILPSFGLPSLAWSHDGRRLLAVDGYDIFVAEVTDEGVGPFVDTGYDTGGERACRRKSGQPMPCQDAAFTFAPDGQRIAYIQRCTWSVPGCMFITTLDLRTGERHELLSTLKGARRPMALPAWSPDGSRIAFTRETDQRVLSQGGTTRSDLYVVDADGQNLRRIDLGGVSAQAPQWSPDGSTIAFGSESWLDGQFLQEDVYTVRTDGSDLRRLTTDAHSAWPEWTADGRIRYRHHPDGGQARASLDFWTMAADGSDAREAFDLNESWGDAAQDVGWFSVPGDPGRTLYWQPTH